MTDGENDGHRRPRSVVPDDMGPVKPHGCPRTLGLSLTIWSASCTASRRGTTGLLDALPGGIG